MAYRKNELVSTASTTGDLSGTYGSTTVAKINGVAVSGTPTTGQVITASSSTAASWATTSITPRANTLTASSNTYTPNCSTTDLAYIASPIASFTIANPTGTPSDGQKLVIRITNGSTAYTPSWGNGYASGGLAALPTSLTASKTLNLGFLYDINKTAWMLLASDGNGY